MTGIQEYLEKFTPLKCFPITSTMSEDNAIRWLIDEAFRASKQMIRTHHKDDIIRFIILAQVLESHGYRMQWVKFKGCVGATRLQHVHTTLPKEVTRYAGQANGGTDRVS
jgi:hypothetical protein